MPLQSMRIASADATGTPLRRFDTLANSEMSEKTIQNLLFRNPGLLGLDSIGATADQLIPVVQEMQTTNAGRIDNLYVDASGRLTIVETKLRRNAQAHREVISQLIEYAVDLAGWSYDELNHAVGEKREDKRDLNAIVRAKVPDDDAFARFQRRLGERMSTGDFELLIVGDRISDRAFRLSGSVNAAPGLRFRLSLIELEIYCDGAADWPWIVVPRVVERMIEHERLVVRVEHAAIGSPRVTVEASKPRGGDEPSKRDDGGRIRDAESFFTSADLPPGFGEILRVYSERWKAAGGAISPTAKLFRWTWDVDGFTHYPLICKTSYVQLNRDVGENEEVNLTPTAHERYLASVGRVSAVGAELSSGGRRVAFDRLTSGDLRTLLDATLSLADDLRRPVE